MEIIWGRFVEKTGGQKSRATVPLNVNKRTTHKLQLTTDIAVKFLCVTSYPSRIILCHEIASSSKD